MWQRHLRLCCAGNNDSGRMNSRLNSARRKRQSERNAARGAGAAAPRLAMISGTGGTTAACCRYPQTGSQNRTLVRRRFSLLRGQPELVRGLRGSKSDSGSSLRMPTAARCRWTAIEVPACDCTKHMPPLMVNLQNSGGNNGLRRSVEQQRTADSRRQHAGRTSAPTSPV